MKHGCLDSLVSVGEDGELVLTFYCWLWSAASWRANGPFRSQAEAERYGATSDRSYSLERRFSAGPLSPGVRHMLAHPTLWLRHPVFGPSAPRDAAQSPAERFTWRPPAKRYSRRAAGQTFRKRKSVPA